MKNKLMLMLMSIKRFWITILDYNKTESRFKQLEQQIESMQLNLLDCRRVLDIETDYVDVSQTPNGSFITTVDMQRVAKSVVIQDIYSKLLKKSTKKRKRK